MNIINIINYIYLPKVYGIRWGKISNNKLEIMFEQKNLFNLDVLKDEIKLNKIKNLHYYIYKERVTKLNGYEYYDHTWVECEKEVILLL